MQVLFHFKPSYQNILDKKGIRYQEIDNELDVILPDVPYTVEDGLYEDPDVQICNHYGFDYDQINCIEAV